MKRFSVLIMALLLIFAVAVTGTTVLAQEGSDFGEVIQRIAELEGLTDQEKKEIMVRSIELRYEDGLEVYQISAVLNEYEDYDGIIGQFDEIENKDSDENDDWVDSDSSEFGKLIQRTAELEGLTDQEKEEIIVRSIELRYEDGLEIYRISAVLDEYGDYDGIMGQFDEIEIDDSDEENDLIDSDNSDFGGIILDIVELENMNNQEKEKIMVRSADLHYEYGLEVNQISAVFDEYDDYDGIIDQFDEIENNIDEEDSLLEDIESTLFGEDALFDEDEDGLFD